LKWYNIWGAFFSPLHANFLMSDWTSSYKDLLNLIKLSQKTVREKFWVEIENEVRIIEN
jgi:UDP-N-acetylmuramate dehydrogenase